MQTTTATPGKNAHCRKKDGNKIFEFELMYQ
jgi:hypothetical protein